MVLFDLNYLLKCFILSVSFSTLNPNLKSVFFSVASGFRRNRVLNKSLLGLVTFSHYDQNTDLRFRFSVENNAS